MVVANFIITTNINNPTRVELFRGNVSLYIYIYTYALLIINQHLNNRNAWNPTWNDIMT